MSKIKASQVFTPGKIPNYTYNERKEKNLKMTFRSNLNSEGR